MRFTTTRLQRCLHAEGPVEFLFVLESAEDPAYAPLTQLCAEVAGRAPPFDGCASSWSDGGAGGDSGSYNSCEDGMLRGGRGLMEGQEQKHGSGAPASATRDARVVLAGLSTGCSQKLHK